MTVEITTTVVGTKGKYLYLRTSEDPARTVFIRADDEKDAERVWHDHALDRGYVDDDLFMDTKERVGKFI